MSAEKLLCKGIWGFKLPPCKILVSKESRTLSRFRSRLASPKAMHSNTPLSAMRALLQANHQHTHTHTNVSAAESHITSAKQDWYALVRTDTTLSSLTEQMS
jgi:hypothetical protein